MPSKPQEDSPIDMVQSMLRKVGQIKQRHPNLSKRIDDHEVDLRRLMEEIRDDVRGLEGDRERKLMTVYLINLTHKAIEEILATSQRG